LGSAEWAGAGYFVKIVHNNAGKGTHEVDAKFGGHLEKSRDLRTRL
jgi:hypothetical protein